MNVIKSDLEKDDLVKLINGGKPARGCLMTRRSFLLTGGIATSVVMIGMPGMVDAQQPAVVSTYPRKLIARLSELRVDEPLDFEYPDEGAYAESILVKLGREAGGGLGPDSDVVAFNYTCTHQGGPLQGTYQAADKALGPCPLHLTTFDLTRHGIFISGQAYQSLPQVLLELDGDDIYAVGMFGLIYGRIDNLQG
ncbi:arsenate reductase (azurin) small subunit [Parasulfitobacter algicola]|uniref:Arsenate reductase (Azurin) small subunit n=1 Tax=Parasulfitobacter algicola TaxID=2614809 RepID=A0ABX2IRX5_9RHOB|nr:arsenate reductase (azurin) small subunit [Sulfitobacter algicola]NSX55652.1 arsenate reductase (azurin) small subunit [Sulfitobacter algicola]